VRAFGNVSGQVIFIESFVHLVINRLEIINMKTISFVVTLAIFVAFFGCSKDDTVITENLTDEQAIQAMVANSDSIAGFSQSDETLIDDPAEISTTALQQNGIQLSKMGFDKTNAHIKVFRWERRVLTINRNITVTFNYTNDTSILPFVPPLATALITKDVSGNIVISAAYSDTATYPDTIIRKPFHERLQRKVLFRKIARSTDASRNWRPFEMTLVEGKTIPESSNSFVIQNLKVYSPADTFTVTDPLTTWLQFGMIRHGIPLVRHTDSLFVKVTLFSTNDSIESVIMRWNGELNKSRERMILVSNTPVSGGYERIFQMKIRTHLPSGKTVGRCNVVVDVFSYGTITDDTIAVSNRLWGFPYNVRW